MMEDTHRHKALVYFRRNLRLVLAAAALCSVALVGIGIGLPQDSVPLRVFLKVFLIQVGTTVLIATTLGVFLTEAYSELRELTIQDEVFQLADRMKELVSYSKEFEVSVLLSYMKQAGVSAFYPDRKGPAQDDLRSRMRELKEITEDTTVYLIGDTLRVFFGSEGPFVYDVHGVLSENARVRFKVLLLNPNCKLALYRSEAETPGAPFQSMAEYRKAGLFHDSEHSSSHIQEWNRTLAPGRGGRKSL